MFCCCWFLNIPAFYAHITSFKNYFHYYFMLVFYLFNFQVAKCDTYSNPPLPHHHRNRRHQRHPRHSHQRHPYDTTQRNGNWRKYHYSQNRANNLIVIPLALQGENTKGAGYKLHKEQEPGSNLKLPENKSLLLSQDKLTGVQRSASETISSTADRNPKKSKWQLYHFTFMTLCAVLWTFYHR